LKLSPLNKRNDKKRSKPMTIETFEKQIPQTIRKSIRALTVKTWYIIHQYIYENGQACIYDMSLLGCLAQNDIQMEEATAMRHLRRMANAGILKAHPMICKPSESEMLHKNILEAGFEYVQKMNIPTTRFKMYTLPGLIPDITKGI
jgi:hypothetical protein